MTLIFNNADKTALTADNKGMASGYSLLDASKLTIPLAAKRLGVGETKMRSIVQQGKIPVLTIGGKTVIIERDIEEYLQGGYGRMKPSAKPTTRSKLTALPKGIIGSPWLKRSGTET
jgi:excisionase family DNA binding protein